MIYLFFLFIPYINSHSLFYKRKSSFHISSLDKSSTPDILFEERLPSSDTKLLQEEKSFVPDSSNRILLAVQKVNDGTDINMGNAICKEEILCPPGQTYIEQTLECNYGDIPCDRTHCCTFLFCNEDEFVNNDKDCEACPTGTRRKTGDNAFAGPTHCNTQCTTDQDCDLGNDETCVEEVDGLFLCTRQMCTHPNFYEDVDMHQYDFTSVHVVNMERDVLNIKGVECSEGYDGVPVVTKCSTHQTPYRLSGCVKECEEDDDCIGEGVGSVCVLKQFLNKQICSTPQHFMINFDLNLFLHDDRDDNYSHGDHIQFSNQFLEELHISHKHLKTNYKCTKIRENQCLVKFIGDRLTEVDLKHIQDHLTSNKLRHDVLQKLEATSNIQNFQVIPGPGIYEQWSGWVQDKTLGKEKRIRRCASEKSNSNILCVGKSEEEQFCENENCDLAIACTVSDDSTDCKEGDLCVLKESVDLAIRIPCQVSETADCVCALGQKMQTGTQKRCRFDWMRKNCPLGEMCVEESSMVRKKRRLCLDNDEDRCRCVPVPTEPSTRHAWFPLTGKCVGTTQCDSKGYHYMWCYTDGPHKWDYCTSKEIEFWKPDTGLCLNSNKCDYHEYHYIWCYTKGPYDWDYCNPPQILISGGRCRATSKRGDEFDTEENREKQAESRKKCAKQISPATCEIEKDDDGEELCTWGELLSPRQQHEKDAMIKVYGKDGMLDHTEFLLLTILLPILVCCCCGLCILYCMIISKRQRRELETLNRLDLHRRSYVTDSI